ncbi:hypothetical protein [Pseudomonas typographi]|uniref:hypothetical protein n=1 Tax=Pseudomonas typographi TaxID=2715964 RepID=UPI001689669B|nr:hypothetical protein [Pseudomonas typographi]MBD1553600.1 hypothetical protein [Pseudomonas typographi]MBD1589639.1 hypothetical protein [Pseudomonas typographi]
MIIAYTVHAPRCLSSSQWGLCGPFLDIEEAQEAVKVFKVNRRHDGVKLGYLHIDCVNQLVEEDIEWARACLARERVLVERRRYFPDPAASFAYHAAIELLGQPGGLDRADEICQQLSNRLNRLLLGCQVTKAEVDDRLDDFLAERGNRRIARSEARRAAGTTWKI